MPEPSPPGTPSSLWKDWFPWWLRKPGWVAALEDWVLTFLVYRICLSVIRKLILFILVWRKNEVLLPNQGLIWTFSEQEARGDDGGVNRERPHWSNKTEYILSMVGFAIGAGKHLEIPLRGLQ